LPKPGEGLGLDLIPGDNIIGIGYVVGQSALQLQTLSLCEQGRMTLSCDTVPDGRDKGNTFLKVHPVDPEGFKGWCHIQTSFWTHVTTNALAVE
jgi:hypothetical protein